MSAVEERRKRWIREERWRGRDQLLESDPRCTWCDRRIWWRRRRARLMWVHHPYKKAVGRFAWVHTACGEHMKVDGLASGRARW